MLLGSRVMVIRIRVSVRLVSGYAPVFYTTSHCHCTAPPILKLLLNEMIIILTTNADSLITFRTCYMKSMTEI